MKIVFIKLTINVLLILKKIIYINILMKNVNFMSIIVIL